jgi:uncharacterized membrane protein HdeD (DUF308 family)
MEVHMANVQRDADTGRHLTPPSLVRVLADNWQLVLLRGIAAIIFGILALVLPGLTLFLFIMLFGAYALVDGAFALWTAFTGGGAASNMTPRWWLVLIGLLGVATAVITVLWPGVTGLVLLYFIAAWALASGVFTIIGAIRLRKEIEGEWLLIANGVLSILIGLIMFFYPAAGALALVWLIGVYALVFGGILVALAFRLKRHRPA